MSEEATQIPDTGTPDSGAPGPAAPAPPSLESPAPPSESMTVTPAPHELPAPEVAETPEPDAGAPGEPVEDPRIAEMVAAQEKMAATLERQRTDARNQALDRLGIPAKYRALAPKADPFTDEGRASLEKFAAEHPEISQPRTPVGPQFDASKYEGKPLVDMDNVRRSLSILKKQKFA